VTPRRFFVAIATGALGFLLGALWCGSLGGVFGVLYERTTSFKGGAIALRWAWAFWGAVVGAFVGAITFTIKSWRQSKSRPLGGIAWLFGTSDRRVGVVVTTVVSIVVLVMLGNLFVTSGPTDEHHALRHGERGPIRSRIVDGVLIQAYPEGPPARPFERFPTGGALPLSEIEQFIPTPLPRPLDQQGCDVGGYLVISFANGTQIRYGPCVRPPAIDRLWQHVVDAQNAPR
jgi:hypothetical protein